MTIPLRDGETSPKMMSVGLHCRLVGRPRRAAALMRFLDYIMNHVRVWVPTRLQIARIGTPNWRILPRTHRVSGKGRTECCRNRFPI